MKVTFHRVLDSDVSVGKVSVLPITEYRQQKGRSLGLLLFNIR